ncbi:MAG: CpaD family pilus assembly lipoprotein [Sneathiella sp.]
MKNFDRLSHKKAGLIGVVLALGISGCAALDPDAVDVTLTANPQNTFMTKQINVQKLSPIFVTRFDQHEDVFTDMEKGRLIGFIQAQKAEFGDVLGVELPSFSDVEGVNETRYGAIGSFLEDQGFQVEPKITRDGLQNSLRVYFTKYIATVDPECAKGWHRPEGLDDENLPLPHMGCSTASALAQMIANPKDLIAPNSMGGYDGERAALSIVKYRSGASSSSGSSEESEPSED